MANTFYVFFVFATLAVAGLVTSGPLKDHFRGKNNIDISIMENKETVTLKAYYPKVKAQSVHMYIKDLFGLTDPIDLGAMEVNQFYTPDSSMNFHIKSRDGYLKIVMNRLQNSQAAYEKVKAAAKGIQRVLAEY
jgi:hypothetical protein